MKVTGLTVCVDVRNIRALDYYIDKTNYFEIGDKILERDFISDYYDRLTKVII